MDRWVHCAIHTYVHSFEHMVPLLLRSWFYATGRLPADSLLIYRGLCRPWISVITSIDSICVSELVFHKALRTGCATVFSRLLWERIHCSRKVLASVTDGTRNPSCLTDKSTYLPNWSIDASLEMAIRVVFWPAITQVYTAPPWTRTFPFSCSNG